MGLPPQPTKHASFATRVESVEDLTPRLRRATLSAPEFASAMSFDPDEYCGLIIPPTGKELVLPKAEGLNIRAELNEIDEKLRPALRWFTVRSHDETAGATTVVFVLHGRSGKKSTEP